MEEALNIICYILSALLGLAVGSFLNVCIYRLPIGKFWSNNRSFCPKCGAPIKAYDNIPLLSYIILGGKCRACKEPISPRYPIIEALNMILWIVNYAVFGMNYITIVYDILVSTLIVVTMIDIDVTEIPDSSVICILLMGLLTFIPVFEMDWKSKLIGAFCVSVPMFIIALFGGMGFGDVKLYAVLGLLFGWEKTLVIFMLSMVVGSIVGIINYVIIKKKGNTESDEECAENKDCDIINNDKIIQDATRINIGETLGDAVVDGDMDTTQDVQNITDTDSLCVDEKCGDSEAISSDLDSITSEVAYADAGDISAPNMAQSGDNEQLAGEILQSESASKEKTSTGKVVDATVDDEEYERKLEEKLGKGKAIPFGPSIAFATLIAMYFGDSIIKFYMGLMGF